MEKRSLKDLVRFRNVAESNPEKPTDITNSAGNQIIDSVDTMSSWLETLRDVTSPAIRNVIQTQLSILSTVESPSLIGMTMDNMTECLKEALDRSSEQEKIEVRKAYSRMLQNSVFIAEAKLRYAVDKNKEEAVQLLENAGTMLTETISSIVELAAPGVNKGVVVKNILHSPTIQNNLFGRLGSVFGNKKLLEEKQSEFNTTLNNIFVILDKYPEYYGKSITINGMVAKYKEQLLDAFVDSQIQPIVSNMTALQVASISDVLDGLEGDLKNVSAIGMVTSIIKAGGKLLSNFAKKRTAESALKSFCRQYDYYANQLDVYRNKLNEEEAELAELKTKGKAIGFFNFADKKDSKSRIEEQEAVLAQCKKDLQSAEEKFRQLNKLCPDAASIKNSIIDYENFLNNLESKYAI